MRNEHVGRVRRRRKNPPRGDERLRDLERRGRAGDQDAWWQYQALRRSMGLPIPRLERQWIGAVGFSTVYLVTPVLGVAALRRDRVWFTYAVRFEGSHGQVEEEPTSGWCCCGHREGQHVDLRPDERRSCSKCPCSDFVQRERDWLFLYEIGAAHGAHGALATESEAHEAAQNQAEYRITSVLHNLGVRPLMYPMSEMADGFRSWRDWVRVNPPRGDEELRRLERAAAMGDHEAARAYAAALHRLGQLVIEVPPPHPFARSPVSVTYYVGSSPQNPTGWYLVSKAGVWSESVSDTAEAALQLAASVAEIRGDGSLSWKTGLERPNPPTGDQRLRALERRGRAGDQDAWWQYQALRRSMGLPIPREDNVFVGVNQGTVFLVTPVLGVATTEQYTGEEGSRNRAWFVNDARLEPDGWVYNSGSSPGPGASVRWTQEAALRSAEGAAEWHVGAVLHVLGLRRMADGPNPDTSARWLRANPPAEDTPEAMSAALEKEGVPGGAAARMLRKRFGKKAERAIKERAARDRAWAQGWVPDLTRPEGQASGGWEEGPRAVNPRGDERLRDLERQVASGQVDMSTLQAYARELTRSGALQGEFHFAPQVELRGGATVMIYHLQIQNPHWPLTDDPAVGWFQGGVHVEVVALASGAKRKRDRERHPVRGWYVNGYAELLDVNRTQIILGRGPGPVSVGLSRDHSRIFDNPVAATAWALSVLPGVEAQVLASEGDQRPNPPTGDQRLRALERAAAAGDTQAQKTLHTERNRRGLPLFPDYCQDECAEGAEGRGRYERYDIPNGWVVYYKQADPGEDEFGGLRRLFCEASVYRPGETKRDATFYDLSWAAERGVAGEALQLILSEAVHGRWADFTRGTGKALHDLPPVPPQLR